VPHLKQNFRLQSCLTDKLAAKDELGARNPLKVSFATPSKAPQDRQNQCGDKQQEEHCSPETIPAGISRRSSGLERGSALPALWQDSRRAAGPKFIGKNQPNGIS
jgi:hypothetical protein